MIHSPFRGKYKTPSCGELGCKTAGEGERRISPEPYLVAKSGSMMMKSPDGLIVFATKHGLSKMKPDGTELAEIIKLQHPPARAMGIADWTFN